MKNILIGILIGLAITLAASLLYYKHYPNVVMHTVYVDTHKSERDSLKKEKELKEKQLAQSETVIETQYTKMNKITWKLLTEKERADSAQARYEREKTIDHCDSTISAKNAVISTQNDKLTEQTVTLNEFKNSVDILKDMDKTNKLTIDSQDKTIQEQTKEIERNNCCSTWFDNHKFWKWAHNPGCR